MVVFFSFLLFLFYLRASDGQTWKQLLICIELGDQGWVEDTRLPSWPRQEVSCKKQPLFNPGWLFFFFLFSPSFVLEENRSLISNRAQTWEERGKEGSPRLQAGPIILACAFFLPYLGCWDIKLKAARGPQPAQRRLRRWTVADGPQGPPFHMVGSWH